MAQKDSIPAERRRQFELIEVATVATLRSASSMGKPLEAMHPVVPFVETNFRLDMELFFKTEADRRAFEADGSSEALAKEFCRELAKAGYPPDWLKLVICRFSSKEVVDRDFEGSYFYFLR